MRIKDAVSNLQKSRPEDPLHSLSTSWGEKIIKDDTESVWQEYPRPDSLTVE